MRKMVGGVDFVEAATSWQEKNRSSEKNGLDFSEMEREEKIVKIRSREVDAQIGLFDGACL